MNLSQSFKPEIKLFLLVALVAVVISVAGILLLKAMQPAPVIEGKALVSGKAVVLSDVVGVPDAPTTEGTIVSIPEERFSSFTNEVERQIEGSLLQRDSILSYVAASSLLGQQGEFELEMDPGVYILCYFSRPTSTEAVRLEACARTHLDAGERLSVRVETMFGSYIVGKGVEMIPLSDIYPLESNSSDTSDSSTPLGINSVEGWQIYRSDEFGFELKYPFHWKLEERSDGRRYSGEDGFFQFSATEDFAGGIDEISKYEAYFGEQYGSKPMIESLKIDGQEARLILPSDDQLGYMKNQAALVILYPKQVVIRGNKRDYLILWVDREHINQILATFRFVE